MKSKELLYVTTLMLVAPSVHGLWSLGSCEDKVGVAVVPANLQNDWFEHSKFISLTENEMTCTRVNIGPANAGAQPISVRSFSHLIDNYVIQTGSITIKAAPNNNRVDVELKNFLGVTQQEYTVLALDTANIPPAYLVLYNCSNALAGKNENVWILTSSSTPDKEITDAIYAKTAENGLYNMLIRRISHGCTS